MKKQGVEYLQAWRALGIFLRQGGSLSGYERNCCFLNTRSEQFADISFVAGLDQISDSRVLAVVDWDQDGDLDLWYSNRTAPRVRYLQNNSSDDGRYIAVRLKGENCNRDAIGARVELTSSFVGEEHTDIQTLRAGEGYLAQSSKWIHFGLGRADVVRMTIRWPGGNEQSLSTLNPNSRYLIEEGQQPVVMAPHRRIHLPAMRLPDPEISSSLRIIPSRRLPLPELQFLDHRGDTTTLIQAEHDATLLTIWATWCNPCIAELQEFERHATNFKDLNIRWVPVNADAFKSNEASATIQSATKLLSRIDVATPTVFATRSAIEILDVVQRVLVAKQDPLPVPCSFLLDGTGRLAAVYKGTVSFEQVARDVENFGRPTTDPRDLAIPFLGYWAMGAFPADLMAIPTELINIGRMQESLAYMVKHVPTEDFEPPITVDQVTQAYLKIGRGLFQEQQTESAQTALLQAIKVDPKNVPARMALGETYLLQRRMGDAVTQYRAVLEVDAQHLMSLNNLAWLLSTCPDKNMQNPQEAVVLAQRLCKQTNYGDPLSLGTLSVALAADGQFQLATERLEKAIRLAKRVRLDTARMEARLRLFRSGKPYLER